MRMLTRAAFVLSAALLACAPAAAQEATQSFAPAGKAPEMAAITVAASSTPCTGTITSSAATSTASGGTTRYPACTASFSSGVGKLGPFVPQFGRAVRVITSQASAFVGSWYVGTSIDSCATVNRLTTDDALKADWTGQVNDYLDVPPTTGGVGYCVVATITSGTLSVAVRN